MRLSNFCCIGVSFALISSGCSSKTETSKTKSGLDPQKFITEVDGKPTALYTLENANGMEVCVTNYGGRIVSIMVPDRNGTLQDVVLGFDSIQDYLPENNLSDFGASIGRYANRIANGRIIIDGDTIQLPQNNFGHCLHGGPDGWQYKVYTAEQPTDSTLRLTIVSPDGDNNFPGEVTATTTYTLHSDNSLAISYEATTDAPTVINMTNHSYFNLNGIPTQPITDNILQINAAYFTPVDSTFMTTGEIAPVAGTDMDFTTPCEIGSRINNYEYDQLKNGNGYDHNWVLDTNGNLTIPAVTLYSPSTGIKLTTYTDEPGIQVYTGNFLDGTVKGKNNTVYNQRAAICLETQHFPDTPNKPEWPSALLLPDQTYKSNCIYAFSIQE